MKFIITSIFTFLIVASSTAQVNTEVIDTTEVFLPGIYNRPTFATTGNLSLGGFAEANTNSFVEDGSPEGFSFEFRRFNLFLSSDISDRLQLFSEVEFQHGTETINLKRALLDFEIHPAAVLRGGVILPPIGIYNANDDAPLWEFVERPLVTTEIIPTTLSEVGFGFHGEVPWRKTSFLYDAYLTNGLGDRIVLNEMGRTRLASGRHENQLATDNNGAPAYAGHLATRNSFFGEVGVSYYGGIYNTFKIGSDQIDEKRWFHLFVFDYNLDLRLAELRGELAYTLVDIQQNLQETFGDRQWGGYVDIIVPVWRPNFLTYNDVEWTVSLRLERVDYNVGHFSSTGAKIYDDINSLTGAISFRPTEATVFRLNYMRNWRKDIFGNPVVKAAGIQFGFATYF